MFYGHPVIDAAEHISFSGHLLVQSGNQKGQAADFQPKSFVPHTGVIAVGLATHAAQFALALNDFQFK